MSECEATLSGLHVFKPRQALREKSFSGFVPGERGASGLPMRLHYVENATIRTLSVEVECLCGQRLSDGARGDRLVPESAAAIDPTEIGGESPAPRTQEDSRP